MVKIKREHIDRLTRGKASGINIGSRKVGHHLFDWERAEYERALKRGYLVLDIRSRDNLPNVWEKLCQSESRAFVILVKLEGGSEAFVQKDFKTVFTGNLAAAKQFAKELIPGGK